MAVIGGEGKARRPRKRKVGDKEKNPWGQSFTRPVPNSSMNAAS